MPVRGLTILVGAGAGSADLRTATLLAMAQAAIGGGARLFLDGAAVALAGDRTASPLLDEAFAAGVVVILCQTGLADAGLCAATLDPRFDYGGLVGLLAGLGDDRLVTF